MGERALPPRNRAASTARKIPRAFIYCILALLLLIPTFALESAIGAWSFIVFGIPALYFARLGYRHFKRRHPAELTAEFLAAHPPVLFLRPFAEDAGWDGATPFAIFDLRTWVWYKMLILTPTNLTCLYLQMTGRLSFEQVLAFVVRKTGPLVAIGEPGSAPILGARNIYVGDDNWQEEVRTIARASRLIVLTAGTSEGVLWEVETILAVATPDRVLLNIPGIGRGERAENYVAFVEAADHLFPEPLPEEAIGERFVTFGPGWIPQLAPRRGGPRHSPPRIARAMRRILA